MKILPTSAAGADPIRNQDAKLRDTALQLEGMFARQLFSAMRATVPTEGIADGGAGEEMFTSLMDEHLADQLPTKIARGFTERMVAQLAGAVPAPMENK